MRARLARHGLPLAVLALVIGIALAALLALLSLRDTSDPLSLEEALERAGGAAGASGRVNGARVPRTGVYAYATSGEERFEAFVSATHTYPRTTTITVSRGGCGILIRWSPLEERETEYELCPGRDGWRLASFLDVHEFFGQGDERRYICRDGVAFRRHGSGWEYTCRFRDRRDRFSGRVLGIETLRVDGRPVSTLHVREVDRLSGEEEGFGAAETWYRRSDGLIVRRIAHNRDRAPVPGGSGTYTERYELRLLSLRPAG